MTHEEHEMMLMLFARLYEAIEVLKETLRSRGLWTEDDEKAFSHAVHQDARKLLSSLTQAYVDYVRVAKIAGVATGLADVPDSPASREKRPKQ